jgi:hypothetical protein
VHRPSQYRNSLQRLVLSLGAKVVPARSCDLCIITSGSHVPAGLPAAALAVAEEWLLATAEAGARADMTPHTLDKEAE